MKARLESPQGIIVVSQNPTGVFFASSNDSSMASLHTFRAQTRFLTLHRISRSSLLISHSIRLYRFVEERGLVSRITCEQSFV